MTPSILSREDLDRIAADARAAAEFPRWCKLLFAAWIIVDALALARVLT